ncbi:hypothetical protein U9M48_010343, partial [Paspalum notatum var. saurae]
MNLQLGELGRNFDNQSPNNQERIEPCQCAFGFDDTQKLLGYFKQLNAENPTFSYAFQADRNDWLTHAFWADAKVRASYYYFGDGVKLETSFVENEDHLPLNMNSTKMGSCVLKRCFTAELSATQRPESLRSLFKKYFHKRTSLPVFIPLFEHVMAGWAEKEALEDLATSFTMPILRFASNMLKQASEIYTITVFNIFEEKFVKSLGYYMSILNNDGLITMYKVMQEETKASFIVSYDTVGKRAQCSCCKFENSGILCRHILRLFLALDVRAIPEIYILKRWTKEAKNGFVLDECLRYSELQCDSLRYVRQGSASGEVFTFTANSS